MKNGNVVHTVGEVTNVKTLASCVHEITISPEKDGAEDISLIHTGQETWAASKLKGERVRASRLMGTNQCVGIGLLPPVEKEKKAAKK